MVLRIRSFWFPNSISFMAFLLFTEKLSLVSGSSSKSPSLFRYPMIEFFVDDIDLPSFIPCNNRSCFILPSCSRRCDSGSIPTRCSLASLRLSTLSFFFFDFTIHDSSFGSATFSQHIPCFSTHWKRVQRLR